MTRDGPAGRVTSGILSAGFATICCATHRASWSPANRMLSS